MPAYSNPDDKTPRRDHGGRRTYQEVVEERNSYRLERDKAVQERDQALTNAMKHEQRAAAAVEELQHATERYQEALEVAADQFEAALKRASDMVPTGALKFGCAHPYELFPKDYNGTIVTDGTYWYCTFNHLRVGVLSRAGREAQAWAGQTS